MAFLTDQQTIGDLGIISARGGDTLYDMFLHTRTRQGAALLEEMFRQPLSDAAAINQRVGIFRYFALRQTSFPFDSTLFDAAERYLSMTDNRARLDTEKASLGRQIADVFVPDGDHHAIVQGVASLVKIVQESKAFIADIPAASPYRKEKAAIQTLLDLPVLQQVSATPSTAKLSYKTIAEYDEALRFRERRIVRELLEKLYLLDVYLSVAGVAVKRNFSFPTALTENDTRFTLDGVYHPRVAQAVSNTLHASSTTSVFFLTGANMAGKSTLMKTVGIALYLAHMGFPVPARHIEFSVLDGIYTTINLPDNIGLGTSHFFSEVQRIKKIAGELGKGRRLLLIFDELFRGTNVKDACDATIALTAAFAKRSSSVLLLSTHIVEAGPALRELSDKIKFIYLPTRMKGNRPEYTYRLEEGITADRHGMLIVQNEGIVDLLKGDRVRADRAGKEPFPADFMIDPQTAEDLNLFGKFKQGSVFGLFNRVKTTGGERLLEKRLREPLCDAAEINRRTTLLAYLQQQQVAFPLDDVLMTNAEEYYRNTGSNSAVGTGLYPLKAMLLQVLVKDESYEQLKRGIRAIVQLLVGFGKWIAHFGPDAEKPMGPLLADAQKLLSDKRLRHIVAGGNIDSLSWMQVTRYHRLLTGELYAEMEKLFDLLYEFDVAIAVTDVAREKGWCYAQALETSANAFSAKNLRHPALEAGVGNDFGLGKANNFLFLTGANMAGKSTLMKAFGIGVYLAHIGFPVAAQEMCLSVRNGLCTSINIADDLGAGYSHFYAEVVRVKKVAEALRSGRSLVVIFDELFKGTNVKDAYDATLAVTSCFPSFDHCWFMVSTHITEVGEALRSTAEGIQFKYLPTFMEHNRPKYTYLLEEGISTDRYGMQMVRNEQILELIAREPVP